MNQREKTILNLYLNDIEFFNEVNNYIDNLVSLNISDKDIIIQLKYFIAPKYWSITDSLIKKILNSYLYSEDI